MRSQNAIHSGNSIKCVGVFNTVGSYGVPAGIGLAPLARYFTLATLGFHDTMFGEHIDVGLHTVAVDERRRPIVPTFWTPQPMTSSIRRRIEKLEALNTRLVKRMIWENGTGSAKRARLRAAGESSDVEFVIRPLA
jgi:Uncharacterized alpha/beta hydrolase domain (DUF2235)